MTPTGTDSKLLASPLLNPAPRLRRQWGPEGRSPWRHVVGELLWRATSPGALRLGGRDIAALWLLEPRDPILRGRKRDELVVQLQAELGQAEGPWPQGLFDTAPLLHLYVTPAGSPAAEGFYVPNGGLVVGRPGQRFQVSRTSRLVEGKAQHRPPSALELWRHRLFSRTVALPDHGLLTPQKEQNDEQKDTIVLTQAERLGPLRAWAPSRALPGAAFDHHAMGFFAILALLVPLPYVAVGQLLGAVSLLALAACIVYGLRPALFARSLVQPVQERRHGFLFQLARLGAFLVVLMGLWVPLATRPDMSLLVVYAPPTVALLIAGARRSALWLVLLALSAVQYTFVVVMGQGGG